MGGTSIEIIGFEKVTNGKRNNIAKRKQQDNDGHDYRTFHSHVIDDHSILMYLNASWFSLSSFAK
jgi:hypothetical protein